MGSKISVRDIPYLDKKCAFKTGIEGKPSAIWVLEDQIVLRDVYSRFHEIAYDEIESISIGHKFGMVGLDALSIEPNSSVNSLLGKANSKLWLVHMVPLKSMGKFEAEEALEFRNSLVSYVEEKIKAANVN